MLLAGKDNKDETQSLRYLLFCYWRYIKKERRIQSAALFVLMIFASFAEVLTLGATIPFLGILTIPEKVMNYPLLHPLIHYLGIRTPTDLLLPITIIFISIAITAALIRIMLLWAQSVLSFTIASDIGREIYQRILYQPYVVHTVQNSSQTITAILVKSKHVIVYIVIPLMNVLNSSLLVFSIVIVLMLIEPVRTLIVISCFIAVYLLIVFFSKSILKRDSRELSTSQTLAVKSLQEGLGGIRDIILDGTQRTYINIYQSVDRRLWKAQVNTQIIGGSPRFIIEAISMSLIAGIGYKLAGNQGKLIAAIPYIGAMAIAAQRLLPNMQQIYSGWTLIRSWHNTIQEVVEMLNQPLPEYADSPPPKPIEFQTTIKFQNIDFRYSEFAPFVLKGLTLEILKGSRVGIIGPTGCGKSTFLDLFMGLLNPENGVLKIDGEVINDRNIRSWQAHIAHVPQDVYLADSSIAENIAFGIPVEHIDHARVRKAAEMACIADVIDSWKDNYNSRVGERGVQLSGGQRQRIGIARALYKQADVIVFDEATSSLDNQTELAVSDSIRQLGNDITVLIIAHRISTLQGCDKIIELENGKVKRQVTYDQLISDMHIETKPFVDDKFNSPKSSCSRN